MGDEETLGNDKMKGEIDTSAPFESVKEAVSKFGGGFGFWKPPATSQKSAHLLLPCDSEDIDVAKVEEQAAELEKELALKEKATFEVLKELEATKVMVEELKSKLQKAEYDAQVNVTADEKPPIVKDDEQEKENNPSLPERKFAEKVNLVTSSSPGLILMELKQAKLNLTRTTGDLAEIRASVESYNKKIERERVSLEKTRERLRLNTMKISSLEEEINQTKSKLEEGKEVANGSKDIVAELQRLRNEAEDYKKKGEDAKSEVVRVMSEIEQTKAKVKTAEIRLVAARKMKEAAKAAEAVALAEIKALQRSSENSPFEENPESITLTFEEYTSLKIKAQDAEQSCNAKVLEAMHQVDEANLSKMDIMKSVEEAMEEVKTSKQALEDALKRVEAANMAKLAVEEALRKWRAENGEKRRSLQNSTKFKNSYPSNRRRDSWVLDVNGVNLVSDSKAPVLKPTLSIGQILSQKLLITEEFESRRSNGKRKVSLGQMLGKHNPVISSAWKMETEFDGTKKTPAKRKKFGFGRFSVILAKQGKKKKKPTSVMSAR